MDSYNLTTHQYHRRKKLEYRVDLQKPKDQQAPNAFHNDYRWRETYKYFLPSEAFHKNESYIFSVKFQKWIGVKTESVQFMFIRGDIFDIRSRQLAGWLNHMDEVFYLYAYKDFKFTLNFVEDFYCRNEYFEGCWGKIIGARKIKTFRNEIKRLNDRITPVPECRGLKWDTHRNLRPHPRGMMIDDESDDEPCLYQDLNSPVKTPYDCQIETYTNMLKDFELKVTNKDNIPVQPSYVKSFLNALRSAFS